MSTCDNRTTTPKHRVLIIDDHPIVRRGLCDVIAAQPDLEVCGEAGDLQEAIHQAEAAHPDVMVIDLTLKGGHGIELIELIKARDERIKMLVSSMHDETLFASELFRAGAMGYISKEEPTERLLERSVKCCAVRSTSAADDRSPLAPSQSW